MDALPEVIRRYVLAVAESTQTSVDMAAVEALGVVSLCSQGKYFIRGNADWAEPLNTYTVVILPPAEPAKALSTRRRMLSGSNAASAESPFSK